MKVKTKKFLREWLPVLALALVLSLTIRSYVAEAMEVPSGSMLPTIQIHDRLVVEKLPWDVKLSFQDIVVFYPPVAGEDKRYVKRLIGLPGDTIEVKDGVLYRNGAAVDEPYIMEPMQYTFGPVEVPEDHYLFLGDNRNDSYDSHMWDTPFVSRDALVGKVLFDIPTHLLYGE